jgi:hypothetical protein
MSSMVFRTPAPLSHGVEVECPPDVRDGIREALNGETVALTDAEAAHYFETGEMPERVWKWLDESSRRRGT